MGLIYKLNASHTVIEFDVYEPRKPKASRYNHYDHFLANMSHMIGAVIMINDQVENRIDVN
jgi:hypothetical protein